MNLFGADADLWFTERRRTVVGELVWLGLLSAAATVQIAALISASRLHGW